MINNDQYNELNREVDIEIKIEAEKQEQPWGV